MDSWVPVERRWLGLDRRTVVPAVVVLAVALLLRSLVPLIDRAVPVDDVIRAGDRFNLDGGLTVTPPVGWELTDGILVGADTVEPGAGSPTASVTSTGVTAQLQVAQFRGDANALLDQLDRNDDRSGSIGGGRTSVTAVGAVGVVESYGSTSGSRLVAAYTFPDGRGLAIEVRAAGDQYTAHASVIQEMLRSVAVTR